MSGFRVRLALAVAALAVCDRAQSEDRAKPSAETVRWFQETEQALMTSVAGGGKDVWDRVMDPACVYTSEEGQVLSKRQFLDELRPLPPGLAGTIAVRELTVLEFSGFAVVRFLADESESVFGQTLTTGYRVTDTFRRSGAGWKMVASHTSVVPRDPIPQAVSGAGWPRLAGRYRLLPDGWTFRVEWRDGRLYGGRESRPPRPFIPLAPDAFVLSGSPGEWLFVTDAGGRVTHAVEFRKFQPLVWTRVEADGR